MNAEAFLRAKADRTEVALEVRLLTWLDAPPRLVEAIRYSLLGGGKRLRPALALGAAEIIAGEDTAAMPAACALEMIHTYSLIHDDLPAMDDDDLRRGRPTLHKAFDEATAILAGDALLTMAFDVAAESGNVGVIREIARAAGVAGMVGGQFLDLEAEGQSAALEPLQRIHAAKTGALIRASVRCGALLAGADAAALESLTRYAEHIGLAFQIADDILDVVGDEATIGKPVGSDVANAKSTYPALLGLEASRKRARDAMHAALDDLRAFGPEAEIFRELARYIVERDK